MTEKVLAWRGSSLADVCAFPAEAERAAGYALARRRLAGFLRLRAQQKKEEETR